MIKAAKLLPRCTSCKATFKTEREFQNHDCVRGLEDLSLEQMMAMYEARKGVTQ